MTTEQLRKEITVSQWYINKKGISIKYTRGNASVVLLLNHEESAKLLVAIGSIDAYCPTGSMFGDVHIRMGSTQMNWNSFMDKFVLSQWEALTLAIRHEMEKELEKDTNLLEMDKAIEALKNI